MIVTNDGRNIYLKQNGTVVMWVGFSPFSFLGWKAAKTHNIDLILGGHSHSFIETPVYYKNLDGKEVPVTQMWRNGVYVGKINLKFERK